MGFEKIRLCPPPNLTESFSSWMQRAALANGLGYKDFSLALQDRYVGHSARMEWLVSPNAFKGTSPDVVEHRYFVALMATASGLPEDDLEKLLLKSETRDYQNQFLVPAGRMWLSAKQGWREEFWCPDPYCPLCLANGYFLRRSWRLAFPSYCQVHDRVLSEVCSRCRKNLQYYEAKSRRPSLEHGKLLCGHCGSDLTLAPAIPAHQQHRAAIQFIFEISEGVHREGLRSWGPLILSAIHWWTEAFFLTCTRLPNDPAASRFSGKVTQSRALYVYQPARVRFALLETALKMLGRMSRKQPEPNADDAACLKWLGGHKWRDLLAIAKDFVRWFPELGEQDAVLAPDRCILLSVGSS